MRELGRFPRPLPDFRQITYDREAVFRRWISAVRRPLPWIGTRQALGRTRVSTLRDSLKMLAAAAAFAALAVGCGGSSATTPTASVPFSSTDITIGTGATASAGQAATVDYTGWLYDASKPDNKGTQFDSSIGRGPFTFTVGAGQVIKGWDQGVPGMRVGGVRRLVIPPDLAYGSAGAGGAIPPNATLVFDITLRAVQ